MDIISLQGYSWGFRACFYTLSYVLTLQRIHSSVERRSFLLFSLLTQFLAAVCGKYCGAVGWSAVKYSTNSSSYKHTEWSHTQVYLWISHTPSRTGSKGWSVSVCLWCSIALSQGSYHMETLPHELGTPTHTKQKQWVFLVFTTHCRTYIRLHKNFATFNSGDQTTNSHHKWKHKP